MRTKTIRAGTDSKRLRELRAREAQITCVPTAESYLKLADEYQALGLVKESDRIRQLAEILEVGSEHPLLHKANGLLYGAANPIMLAEVMQILSRTTLTGDLSIDTPAETYHVYFNQGRIINASSQQHAAGLPSFRMALRVTSGSYRFVEVSVDGLDRFIHEPTEILLLNALHEADIEAGHKSTA